MANMKKEIKLAGKSLKAGFNNKALEIIIQFLKKIQRKYVEMF